MPILPMSCRIAPSRTASTSPFVPAEADGEADGERGEPLAVAVQVGIAQLDRVRERRRERRREQPLAELVARCSAHPAGERVGDGRLQLALREGLGDEAGGAAGERLAEVLERAGAGDEDDRQCSGRRAWTPSIRSRPEQPGMKMSETTTS